MPPIVLTTLKFLFIALLYLFIARSIRIIYLDLVGPRVPKQQGQSSGTKPVRRTKGAPKAVAVLEAGKPERIFSLEDELTFGRAEHASVQLDDTYVSTIHTRLFMKDGQWFVEDVGSTNGTYLNRVKVTSPTPIAIGDEVRVGKTIVSVRRS